MDEPGASIISQIQVVLRGTSPLIWRRLLVRRDSMIADLHPTLQIAVGGSDTHRHRFVNHGKAHGVAHLGGRLFADDPTSVRLAGPGLRPGERFGDEDDVGDLRHGNVHHALQEIEAVAWRTDAAAEATAWHRTLAKAVAQFQTDIENNGASLPNDGERSRTGEAIRSAVAESAVNHVISTRMVKKKQVRWSPDSAHLRLPVRTQVLNDDLRGAFRRWYPGFDQPVESQAKIA